MRILFHHRIRSKDGQAVHMDELVHAFQELGHEVLLVGPKSFARASFGHDPKLINALKSRIPQFAYEILELGYNVVAFARLEKASRQFKPDFLYERHNLYTLAGAWVSRLHRLPRLLEINAPLAHERAANDGLALRWLAHLLEDWSWRTAAFALPVTHVLAGFLRRGGVKEKCIRVIPNAINKGTFDIAPSSEEAKASLGLDGKIVVGFTGFVREWHGLDRVVDWLGGDAPRTAHLLVVGEGPALAGLKAKAAKLGLSERVTFAGLVGRDRIAGYTAAFDIAIVPKCVEYCSPLKLFEYMALGKAILAPDQANIREILTDGKSTLLFDPNDKQSLSRALGRLACDCDLRRSLGERARQIIASRGLWWSNNAQRIIALAQEAIAAKDTSTSPHLAARLP